MPLRPSELTPLNFATSGVVWQRYLLQVLPPDMVKGQNGGESRNPSVAEVLTLYGPDRKFEDVADVHAGMVWGCTFELGYTCA